MADQFRLFEAGPALPEGFRYQRELISEAAERELLESIRGLPFREFELLGNDSVTVY